MKQEKKTCLTVWPKLFLPSHTGIFFYCPHCSGLAFSQKFLLRLIFLFIYILIIKLYNVFSQCKIHCFLSIFSILRKLEHMAQKENWLWLAWGREGYKEFNCCLQLTKEELQRKQGQTHFRCAHKKARGNGCKLHHRKFQLDINIILFTTRVCPSTET